MRHILQEIQPFLKIFDPFYWIHHCCWRYHLGFCQILQRWWRNFCFLNSIEPGIFEVDRSGLYSMLLVLKLLVLIVSTNLSTEYHIQEKSCYRWWNQHSLSLLSSNKLFKITCVLNGIEFWKKLSCSSLACLSSVSADTFH